MSGGTLGAAAVATVQGNVRPPHRLPADPHWWAGALLSAATLLAVGLQLGQAGIAQVWRSAPTAPVFWFVFAGWYLALPICEWTIFRRLWRLPRSGLAALVRKQVANELVLGYSGEAQFYLWARRHAELATSPFGAVKDVAVLSAMGGNVATLALMAANWGMLTPVLAGPLGRAFALSAGVVALVSLATFLLRRRLFSLAEPELVAIASIHAVRIVASMVLLAALLHHLLPGLRIDGILTLVTLRLMLSRMPFLPAKDVVFAGLVAAMLGRGAAVVPAIALLGSLVVATHVAVAVCSAAASLARKAAS